MGLIMFITVTLLYMGRTQHLFVLETLAGEEKEKITKIYDRAVENLYEKYELIGEQLLLDKELIAAIKSKNRPKILEITAPTYAKLRANNPYLEIMHFHTPDTHSLLRLHKPEVFGDDLSRLRPLIKKTNETHEKNVGLEVGKYGISHRVALPIFDHTHAYLGTLEFGINAEYITGMLQKIYGIDSLILMNKKDVDTFMTFSDDANAVRLLGNFALFRSSRESLLRHIDLDKVNDTYQMVHQESTDHLVFKGAELTSFDGTPIGNTLLIKDMSFYMDKVTTIRNISILLAVMLLTFSFLILRYSYHRFMRKIDVIQQRLIQKNRTLTKLSTIDHLTKANNRRKIEDILYSEYKITKRYGMELGIILLDVDNFKHVNDTFGHNIGDKVLRKMGKVIAEHIRETDFFGRWGGEEFLIVAPNTNLQETLALAEKLRVLIAQEDFEEAGELSASFGVAACDTDTPVKTSIKHADDALYQAKETGKNRVVGSQALNPSV